MTWTKGSGLAGRRAGALLLLGLALAVAAAPATEADPVSHDECCRPPPFAKAVAKGSPGAPTLVLVIPPGVDAKAAGQGGVCGLCSRFWHAGAAAASLLRASRGVPRMAIHGAGIESSSPALARQAAAVADYSETVSVGVSMLTKRADKPEELRATSPVVMCRPGKAAKAGSAPAALSESSPDLSHWYVAHTQQPSALAVIALASSHCGFFPRWTNVGAPSPAAGDWLRGGPGGDARAWPLDPSVLNGTSPEPARILLVPLHTAAAESALASADAAAALLAGNRNAPFKVAVASAPLGAAQSFKSVASTAVRSSARDTLRAMGLANAAPPPPPDTSAEAGNAAAPADPPGVLAVMQNPFALPGQDASDVADAAAAAAAAAAGAAYSPSDGVRGLPAQLVWWASKDVNSLAATARAAVASTHQAASRAAAAAASAAAQADTRPLEAAAAAPPPATGIAFSTATHVLAAMTATAPVLTLFRREDALLGADRASARARKDGLNVSLALNGTLSPEYEPGESLQPASLMQMWSTGRAHGAASLASHFLTAHVASMSCGVSEVAAEPAAPILPTRAKSGAKGSLGLWAVLVCDRLSGPCRAAAAEWRALAEAIAGPVAAPGAAGDATATVDADGQASPPTVGAGAGRAGALSGGKAAGYLAYLRHWGVALAALDSTEARAHPLLRAMGIRSTPTVVALSSTAEKEKSDAAAQALLKNHETVQEEATALSTALGWVRRAGSFGLNPDSPPLSANALAKWLAGVAHTEALSLAFELGQTSRRYSSKQVRELEALQKKHAEEDERMRALKLQEELLLGGQNASQALDE